MYLIPVKRTITIWAVCLSVMPAKAVSHSINPDLVRQRWDGRGVSLCWQYMEAWSDQWRAIRGNFGRQTYKRVMNCYVRQQCSRFIHRGYDIVETECQQTLEAVSSSRDTLLLVLLNEGDATVHNIKIENLKRVRRRSSFFFRPSSLAYRTSETEDMQRADDAVSIKEDSISVVLPSRSVTTVLLIRRLCDFESYWESLSNKSRSRVSLSIILRSSSRRMAFCESGNQSFRYPLRPYFSWRCFCMRLKCSSRSISG